METKEQIKLAQVKAAINKELRLLACFEALEHKYQSHNFLQQMATAKAASQNRINALEEQNNLDKTIWNYGKEN